MTIEKFSYLVLGAFVAGVLAAMLHSALSWRFEPLPRASAPAPIAASYGG